MFKTQLVDASVLFCGVVSEDGTYLDGPYHVERIGGECEIVDMVRLTHLITGAEIEVRRKELTVVPMDIKSGNFRSNKNDWEISF